MLEGLKTRVKRFLDLEPEDIIRDVREDIEVKGYGGYGFQFYPEWGRGEKVKPGDVNSMLMANVGWVYDCVNVLAINTATVPMKVYKPTEFEDKLIKDHPFYKLIKHPNNYQSSYDFKYLFQGFLDLTGSTYIHPVLNAFNRPVELHILPSQFVSKIRRDNKIFYEYTGTGTMQIFEFNQIIHVKYPNPQSPLQGLSPLEASRMAINLLAYMGQYQLSLMANRARPDALLHTEQSVSPQEAERVRIEWKKKYGGIDKAGEMAVLGSGLTYQQLSLSPADLEYLKSREFTQGEIAAAYNVPPHKLGRMGDVNKSSAHELEHSFQKDSISPRLWLRDMYLTDELISLYDPSLIVKSDNVIPIDKEFMREQEDMDLKHGVITINDVRARRNMKPVPYGNIIYLPFNLQPMGSASIYTESSKPKKESEKIFILQDGGIVKELNWGEHEQTMPIQKQWQENHWRAYVKRTEVEEKNVISILGGFFDKQEKAVLRNLRKLGKEYKDTEVYLPSLQEENKKLAALMIPLLTYSVIQGGESLVEDFGLGIEFDGSSPFVQTFFRGREKLIKDINNTTFEKLKFQIQQGINDGETMKEIAGRVETVFTEAKGPRAMKIARTEVNTANNYGHLEAMRQANVENNIWVTAADERVRDTHYANEGDGCIPREQPFSGTGEVIPSEANCRCEILPCIE